MYSSLLRFRRSLGQFDCKGRDLRRGKKVLLSASKSQDCTNWRNVNFYSLVCVQKPQSIYCRHVASRQRWTQIALKTEKKHVAVWENNFSMCSMLKVAFLWRHKYFYVRSRIYGRRIFPLAFTPPRKKNIFSVISHVSFIVFVFCKIEEENYQCSPKKNYFNNNSVQFLSKLSPVHKARFLFYEAWCQSKDNKLREEETAEATSCRVSK